MSPMAMSPVAMSPAALLAAAAAAAAGAVVLLWWPPGRWAVSARLGRPARPSADGSRRRWSPSGGGRLPILGAGAAMIPVALVVSGPGLVTAAAVVAVAGFGWSRAGDARRRSARRRRRAEALTGLDLLIAEVRAGSAPRTALAAVAEELPGLEVVTGFDEIPTVLRAVAARPGAEPWAAVAATWEVSDRSGAPLAAALERLAATLREEEELNREVAAEAAPARATGTLMAGLPLVGLALGSGLGADPVQVLTGTAVGAVCVAAGAALACAGMTWIDAVIAAAERS